MELSKQARRARSRLRVAILLFCAFLAIPLGLLVMRVYSQLRMESFVQYRAVAEDLVTQFNTRLTELVSTEERRAFDEYSFFSVVLPQAENIWGQNSLVGVSPLSKYPLQSNVPGIIGYFELTPEGELTTPLLPKDAQNDKAIAPQQQGMRGSDLASRRQVLSRLRGILLSNQGLAAQLTNERTREDGRLGESSLSAKLGQQLGSLNFDERFYRADRSTIKNDTLSQLYTSERSGRKESLNVVTQAAPSQSFENELAKRRSSAKRPPEQLGANYMDAETAAAGRDLADQNAEAKQESGSGEVKAQAATGPSDFQVSVVEGDIDPFQVELLPDGHFAFFRKVWRNKQRFVQGFVVDARQLLEQLIRLPFETRQANDEMTMIVGYQGQVFQTIGAMSREPDILLYRARAVAPLNDLEFVFTSPGLPLGSRSSLVDLLLLSLCLILGAGFFLLYRLGVSQIVLAEQQSNFVSAVSHELKTPLTSIRMYGEMLRSGVVADEAKRQSYYDYIFHESERLSRLIANVLQMARLARDRAELSLAPMTVGAVLDLVRSRVASAVESAGFVLSVELPEELRSVEVLLDEDAIVRVFINLVDNALKFARAATRKEIVIGARLSGGGNVTGVELFVRDFGPGVDGAQKRKLFKLFYRAESELTRSTPGTGIGLALVRELVSRMRGSVDVDNRNPGAEFLLRFNLRLA